MKIDLDKRVFNINVLLNDIIKINDIKICFIGTSNNMDMLYVVLLNIFGIQKVVDTCKEETDEHYSAFMILSYANGTDYSLNVTDYLLKNNDITIDKIIISLKGNTFIENNIFGYEYLNIRLLNIENCSSILFYSSIETSKIFIKNNYLEKDENIWLKFSYHNDIQNCIIKYEYIVTEPSYENDEKNYTEKIGIDSEPSYELQRDEYTGRTIHYFIISEKYLETNCESDNCKLCLKENITYCITCKNNSEIRKTNGKIEYKICYGEETINTKSSITESDVDTQEPYEKIINKFNRYIFNK